MPRRLLVVVALAGLVVACRAPSPAVPTTGDQRGSATAVEAVERLRGYLVEGDFEAAGSLGVPGQAVLASLGEGATPGEVVAGLESGGGTVAANFWTGFAQGAAGVLEGEVTVETEGTVTESGVDFTLVSLSTDSGASQRMVTRMVDGHRVDIFASFGAALAGRMISPVELILDSSTAESRRVLAELGDVVPSLRVAATDRRLSPQAVQEILQLIELITRLG